MKVVNSNRTSTVYWMYTSGLLAKALAQTTGEDVSKYETLPYKKQLQEAIKCPNTSTSCHLALIAIQKDTSIRDMYIIGPTDNGLLYTELSNILKRRGGKVHFVTGPDTTWCFLTDDTKQEVGRVSVKRFHKDPDDRTKARKYAFSKLLKQCLPEDKAGRTKFWETYLKKEETQATAVYSAPGS